MNLDEMMFVSRFVLNVIEWFLICTGAHVIPKKFSNVIHTKRLYIIPKNCGCSSEVTLITSDRLLI